MQYNQSRGQQDIVLQRTDHDKRQSGAHEERR